MVSLARKNLLHDRLRFVITVAGVAFAVTLVLVQVGLFMGLLDKSTVTIRNASADLWITSRNTPNVDFARTFPETAVLRARSVPGVARADNLIVAFMNIQLPNGAPEGALVYALEDFSGLEPALERAGGLARRPEARLRAADGPLGGAALRRRSPSGEQREILGRRFRIVGTTEEAASFTTTPIVFMDYRNAQELQETLRGNTTYVLVKLAPGADARRRAGRAAAAAALQRRPHARRVGAAVAQLLGEVHRPRHEHGRHGLPRDPGRDRDRGADALHLGGRAHQGVRHGEGDRRLEPRRSTGSSASRR